MGRFPAHAVPLPLRNMGNELPILQNCEDKNDVTLSRFLAARLFLRPKTTICKNRHPSGYIIDNSRKVFKVLLPKR